MTYTPPTTAGLAVGSYTSPAQSGRIASPSGQPLRVMPLMRTYEVAHLTTSLTIEEDIVIAPALPVFETAFTAFGRGAILRTENGPMAVEDLLPGDRVMTAESGFQTLMWRGAITLHPARNGQPSLGAMTRITTDAMGYGRPNPDLVLGPSARILYKNPAIKMLTGTASALVPIRDFVDGSSTIALNPMSPVQCYQLGFQRHCCVNVNGIDVETLHPGPAHLLSLTGAMKLYFEQLFAHKADPADFGPMIAPRLRMDDINLVTAA